MIFQHRLAAHLSWPSIAWGMPRMGAREYGRWKKYFSIEPFGPMQEDLRAAYTPTILLNVHRKKGSSARKVEEMFVSLKQLKPKQQSLLELTALVETLGALGDAKRG